MSIGPRPLATILLVASATASIAYALAGANPHDSASVLPTSAHEWLGAVGGIAGLAALAWKLIEFLVHRTERTSDRNAKIVDFWFNSVIVPRCTIPLCDFVAEMRRSHAAIGAASGANQSKAFAQFNKSLSARLQEIFTAIEIITVFNRSEYERIRNRLEQLDDGITQYCAVRAGAITESSKRILDTVGDPDDQLSSCLIDTLDVLVHLHATFRLARK